MICSYCETETENKALICEFCGADLQTKRPSRKDYIHLELAEEPQPVLTTYHTYDLLILLRLVRQERTKAYDLMRTIQKSLNKLVVPPDTLKYSEGNYKAYTKRMKVIEGILIDRMGYKPNRVDNKLLVSLEMKMRKDPKF